jgi:hypothetical protein
MYQVGSLVRVKSIAQLEQYYKSLEGEYALARGPEVVCFSREMFAYCGTTFTVAEAAEQDGGGVWYWLSLPTGGDAIEGSLREYIFEEWMLEAVSLPVKLESFLDSFIRRKRYMPHRGYAIQNGRMARYSTTAFEVSGDRIRIDWRTLDKQTAWRYRAILNLYGYKLVVKDESYTITERDTGIIRDEKTLEAARERRTILHIFATQSKPQTVCPECGQPFDEECMVSTDSGLVCETCREEYYVRCQRCGNYVHEDNTKEGLDGNTYCESCFDSRYVVCSNCDTVMDRDDAFSYGGSAYCNECRDELFSTCDHCGEWVPNDELNHLERRDEYLCNNCYSESGRVIHDYGYKPTYIYYGNDGREPENSRTLYLGMEQELYVPRRDNLANALTDLDPHEEEFYLGYDGSLRNGFEVISHPRTFESWKEYLTSGTYADVLRLEAQHKAKGHNEGGIHLHTSISAWEGNQFYLAFSFIYDPHNRDQLYTLAQRHNCGADYNRDADCGGCPYSCCCMSHYASLLAVDYGKSKRMLERKEPGAQNDRYAALNQTRRTLEFRLFNSNTRVERILKNIETVQSLYDYTKIRAEEETRASSRVRDGVSVSWNDWTGYVEQHQDTFPNLWSFLTVKRLVASPAVSPAVEAVFEEEREAI